MPELFFDRESQDALVRPEAWRLASTLLPSDVGVARDRHRAWRKRHAHTHPYPELLVVLRGRTAFGLCGRAWACGPGTIFYVDGDEPHDLNYPPRSPPLRHLWISLFQDHAVALRIEIGRGAAGPPWRRCCVVPRCDLGVDVPHVARECRNRGDVPPLVRRLWLLSAALTVVSRVAVVSYDVADQREQDSIQARTVEAIRRHLEQTGGCGASLANLARIAGYSKFHFLRLFQRHTGHRVHAYVDRCREQKMVELQREGHSLKEIGDRLGFSCQAAFCRWRRHRHRLLVSPPGFEPGSSG